MERQGSCEPRAGGKPVRSEEHTSELQSQSNLVCRLLLEKKKSPSAHRRTRPAKARLPLWLADRKLQTLTYSGSDNRNVILITRDLHACLNSSDLRSHTRT